MLRTALLALGLAGAVAGPAEPALAGTDPEVRLLEGLVYAERAGEELALDLALPVAEGPPRPVLVFIHGGGWAAGSRARYQEAIRREAQRGFAAASVDYRLAPRHRWPAQWEDVQEAVRFLRDHAEEYGLDPRRIGALGDSAGGHLALLLGLVPDPAQQPDTSIQAVVNFYGPVDLTRDDFPPGSQQFVDGLLKVAPELSDVARAASPLFLVTPGDAPVLTVHGLEDPAVSPDHGRWLHAALAEAGVPQRLELVAGMGHSLDGRKGEQAWSLAQEWLDLHLVGSPLPLVAHEDFDDAEAAARWQPTDPSAWTVEEGGWLALTKKDSSYQPPVRSPLHRALLEDVVVSDFVLDVRVQTTHPSYGHRDLCLFFGYQDESHFYYVHLGQVADPNAHSVFLVDGSPRTGIAQERTEGTPWDDGWHRVRVRREVTSGVVEVFFDDLTEPIMKATDRTFTWGRIGVGSFDDTGRFDEIRLRARTVEGRDGR